MATREYSFQAAPYKPANITAERFWADHIRIARINLATTATALLTFSDAVPMKSQRSKRPDA